MKTTTTPGTRTNPKRKPQASAPITAAAPAPASPAPTATTISVPDALTTLKEAYLAEPLQRDTTTAQPLAEALTDFFAQLLPDTERKSLHTLTKFCLMELTLIKLTRAGKDS